MAGGHDSAPSTKTGLAKHFDTMTVNGRKNCTLASLAFYLSLFLIYKIKSSSSSSSSAAATAAAAAAAVPEAAKEA